MKPDANPRRAPGKRNALCPYYEGCLTHAVEHQWRFWDCSFCPHRLKKESLSDPPMVKDPDPEYPVVGGIITQSAVS